MRRRNFLAALAAAPRSLAATPRSYHLCAGCDALDSQPELIEAARAAGVSTIWVAGFLYGHWYYTPKRIEQHIKRIRQAGLQAEIIHVPLGHPGDSLGAQAGQPPLIPPPHWRQAVRPNAPTHWGTSLHAPATDENAAAARLWRGKRVTKLFLDDDFRLATGPGAIGGCHCDDHWARFAQLAACKPGHRANLKEDIANRALTPLLRAWVDFHCTELTNCFKQIEAAAKPIDLGIMAMYLGSEKAGIHLPAYRNALFRVGELMFEDRHFDPVKGKTDELFSALFHRRFAAPERAFSETTAFPANRLSAPNMAAKLAVSTLADIRNTMFMSGLTPFPLAHWQTLGPAMRRQAELHARVAGLKPAGPFKHYWGEAARYVGRDKPYSLFLAAGVPFEVCDSPRSEGWTFLCDEDSPTGHARPITRAHTPETLEALFAFRRSIATELAAIPHIEEELPAVCSWYRDVHLALVWNLSREPRRLTLRHGANSYPLELAALELTLVELRPA